MKLYGVFIGVDTYFDANIQNLQYASADAVGFYELIKEHLSPEDYHLQLLTNAEATKQAVVKAIGEDLSRVVSEDDVVILFFAGHGSPETSGSIDKTSRYLVLYDTEYENIFATGLDMERELSLICFERLKAKLIVLFVDACFSGRAGGRTFEGPKLLRTRIQQGMRGTMKLTNLELGEGRVIITASDENEVARESTELKHGIFTHALLEILSHSVTSEPLISIASLYDTVAHKVHNSTMGRQHAIFNGRSKLGKLPLFFKPDDN